MANTQKIKSDALATIDTAVAILNKFPFLNGTDTSLSFNTSMNPFPFLLDVFKSTAGYNVLINILSKFILVALPPMEVAIKGVLLANIKNLLSCSINPFISDEILRDGIVFDLQQIDITDKLKYCPTDNIGRNYYFDNTNGKIDETIKDENGTPILDQNGNEQTKRVTSYKLPEELKYSKDFDCLLWYVKNNPNFREVWGKKNTDNDSWEKDSDYWNSKKNKCRKGAGIVTLEFNPRSQGLRNAKGNGLGIQTPYNNIIHVFIGNTQEKENNAISAAQADIAMYTKQLTDANNSIQALEESIEQINEEKNLQKDFFKKNKITQDEYNHQIERLDKQIQIYREQIDGGGKDEKKGLKNKIKEATAAKIEAIKNLTALHETSASYRDIKENYYYRHTLIEFNTDYVMSLKLFDAKVITAQLIDALVGLLNIDLELSFKQQLIKEEIENMIKMVVETDDTVVSDCFFTFNNEAYDNMLQKSELNRIGLFTVNGEENTANKIDIEKILESINNIDDDAISGGDTTVIEHALTEISKTISSTNESESISINFGVQMNFIENLMNNLAYVLTYAVISPKLYLLILINLRILGQETNFNLEQFIAQFKHLIVEIIRAIRDELLKYLTEELMKILGKLATEISIKIGLEQAQYYARLIKKIFDCIKFGRGKGEGWSMDDVDYADIASEEVTEEKANTEC